MVQEEEDMADQFAGAEERYIDLQITIQHNLIFWNNKMLAPHIIPKSFFFFYRL